MLVTFMYLNNFNIIYDYFICIILNIYIYIYCIYIRILLLIFLYLDNNLKFLLKFIVIDKERHNYILLDINVVFFLVFLYNENVKSSNLCS